MMLTCSVELPGSDAPNPDLDVSDLLRAWIRIWARWLHRHPEFPLLYSSGVRYEPEVTEQWQAPPTTLRRGYGDCEDLTVWRGAELVARGVAVAPRCIGRRTVGGGYTQHVSLVYPDGRTEDPSIILLRE